jgi:hypothetical protein
MPAMANHQTQLLGYCLHFQVPTPPRAAERALSPPTVRPLIPRLTSEWCAPGRFLGVRGNEMFVTIMLLDPE